MSKVVPEFVDRLKKDFCMWIMGDKGRVTPYFWKCYWHGYFICLLLCIISETYTHVECSNINMNRDERRPLVDRNEVPLVEDEFTSGFARSSFRRSMNSNFVCSNHGYDDSSCGDESDLRGSMRAASQKYQESVARLRSSQRQIKSYSVGTGGEGNKNLYLRQNSSPAPVSPGNSWETGSAISNNSFATETSGYQSSRSNIRDYLSNSHVPRQGRFQIPRSVTTPNFPDTNTANDSGYCGNNTPRQTGTSRHNNETIKSRVTISRNSGEYADVTQPRVHVTNVSFTNDHQADTVDGASEDEEADMLHSMHRRSPFRRSVPRRHSYHNLKNAYQSQVLFKQKQQSLQQQNQNQTLNIEVSASAFFPWPLITLTFDWNN